MRYFAIILLFCSTSILAQKKEKKLAYQLQNLVNDFNGEIGFYVHNLRTNRIVSFNADTVFPTASIVKVPIMIGIMDKIQRGELSYHQSLVYKDSLLYEGEDILGSYKNNEKVELSKVLMLMLTTSDNTASLWLQSLAGKGTRINEIMDTLGLIHTRVNSRTPGRENNRGLYGWGQTTPKEMADLMQKIVAGQIINKEMSDKMIRLMGRNYWDEEGLSQIPAGVFVASKNGAVNASRSELMYVNHPKNPLIISIFTKNNKDTSWGVNNEAWILTRKMVKTIWEFYQ
jgi:beta-lactamase class A